MDIRGRFFGSQQGPAGKRLSSRKRRKPAFPTESPSLQQRQQLPERSDPVRRTAFARHTRGIEPDRIDPGPLRAGNIAVRVVADHHGRTGLYPCQIEGVFENARIGFVRPGVFGANDAPEIAVQPAVTQLDLLHSGETVGHDIHRIPPAQLADDFPRMRNQAAERRGELQVIVGQSPGQRPVAQADFVEHPLETRVAQRLARDLPVAVIVPQPGVDPLEHREAALEPDAGTIQAVTAVQHPQGFLLIAIDIPQRAVEIEKQAVVPHRFFATFADKDSANGRAGSMPSHFRHVRAFPEAAAAGRTGRAFPGIASPAGRHESGRAARAGQKRLR